jgi:hypothetical protein
LTASETLLLLHIKLLLSLILFFKQRQLLLLHCGLPSACSLTAALWLLLLLLLKVILIMPSVILQACCCCLCICMCL